MVNIYLINLEEIRKISKEYGITHFPKRYEKMENMKHEDDKARCFGAGALMYSVLELEDKDIFFGENGKPYSNNAFFNLSHSGDFVALATSSCEIGVDIEALHLYDERVAKRMFTQKENAWVIEDKDNRFSAMWCRKESVMKYTGKGLSLLASSFDTSPAFFGNPISVDEENLYIKSLDYYGYSMAICQNQPIDDVKIHELTYNDIN